MADLNTAQIAHRLLGGQSHRLYHQNVKAVVTDHQGNVLENPHHHIDLLGSGDFGFLDIDPAGQNPKHAYEEKGLLTSIERPLIQSGVFGHNAAVNLQNIALPDRFVLTATFVAPKQESLIPHQPPVGHYSPVLLLSNSTTMKVGYGATSQFRDTGQRLNSPGLASPPNRPDIDPALYQEVTNGRNPSEFTLVLRVERGADHSKGHAKLFVGDVEADSFDFIFDFSAAQGGGGLTTATPLDNIRVGIATATDGTSYRASVYLTEFELWAPVSGVYGMRAVHSHLFADIKGGSTSPGKELIQWDWNDNDNQRFYFKELSETDPGYYQIQAVHSGLFLHGDGTSGGNVIQSTEVEGDYQKWKVIPANDGDGSFYIQSKSSGMVMSVEDGLMNKGKNVIQRPSSGFPYQRWFLMWRDNATDEASSDAPLRSPA